MSLKIIRIFFISFLLVINAYAYYLFYRPNIPKHQEYIPQHSVMVFSVNSRHIAGKLAYSALFHKKDFSELLEDQSESEVSWADNINNGLDLLGKITFLIIPVSDSMVPVSVILADISSSTQLDKYLRSQELEPEEIGNNISFAVQGPTSAVGYNNEIAVFLNGGIDPAELKDEAVNILEKKYPLRKAGTDELYADADFSIAVYPGVQKMDEKPSLKGMIGSFINALYFSGDFGEHTLGMQYVLQTDQEYVPDASEVFTSHNQLPAIPEELKDGIFRMHLTLNADRWVEWMKDANMLNIPDTLIDPVYGGLSGSLGEQFLVQMNSMKLIRVSWGDSVQQNSRAYPVPEFSVAFSLVKPDVVHELFERMLADSLFSIENGLYRYDLPFEQHYYFYVGNKSLVMATNPDLATETEFEFHGISNWFYFNVKECIEALPDEDLGISIAKGMLMEENKSTIHYGYGYSIGTEANKVKFVGNVYYNNPEKYSLIETIKFMNISLAMITLL